MTARERLIGLLREVDRGRIEQVQQIVEACAEVANEECSSDKCPASAGEGCQCSAAAIRACLKEATDGE